MRKGTTNRKLWIEPLESRHLLAGDIVTSPIDGLNPLNAEENVTLRLIARDTFVPGVPVLVRAHFESPDGKIRRDIWDATVELTPAAPGVSFSAEPIVLKNGMGSTLVTVHDPSDVTLTASWGDTLVEKHFTALVDPVVHQVSGTLDPAVTRLGGVVRVTGDLRIPTGHHLEIDPGTLVLIDGQARSTTGKRIIVEGSLTAAGSADEPITFTATDPNQPWGEIDVNGGSALFTHTVITRAGSSRRGGHTNTGPAMRLGNDGSLTLSESTVADISGKIMQASSGSVTMIETLLTRAVMGPEIDDTALEFRDSWIMRMAGRFHPNGTVDDNDGIYLHSQAAGQEILIAGSVVADVQDDGIDTLGSNVVIRDTIVRDADDKAVSVFNGDVLIQRGLLVNSAIGVETKGIGATRPNTTIDRTTIANVGLGIHAHDKGTPDPDVVITYNVTNSIIHVVPDGDPIKTDYDPRDLHVNYTLTREPWEFVGSGEGNVDADPGFADLAANDFRLRPDSPAVDAGEPGAALDPDGTRADLGFFPYYQTPSETPGDLNGDQIVNAHDVDLLCAAIRDGVNEMKFDFDGDGQVSGPDVDHLITGILQTAAGDANLDGVFDSSDLVLVFQAGEYEDGVLQNSGWSRGDWNCDGEFSSSDLVAAFQTGRYVGAARTGRSGR